MTETLQAALYSNNYWKHSDFSSVIEVLIIHYNADIEMDTEKKKKKKNTILCLENKTIGYICLN